MPTDVDQIDRELRRCAFFPGTAQGSEDRAIGESIPTLLTIKVTTKADSPFGRSTQRMHDLAQAAVFHFAFGQGVSISLTKSWERTYYWLGRKEV